MAQRGVTVTCGDIETRGTAPYSTSGWCDEMAGCKGETYADKKVDLLHQLGFYNVTVDIFKNCKSESEIDRQARSIILS